MEGRTLSNDELHREQARLSDARAAEAIAEAEKYRLLWQAAASCLTHNAPRLKVRGDDERKIIEIAATADHGRFWSGTTRGWL